MEQDGLQTNQNLSEGTPAPEEAMVPASKVNEIVKTRMMQAAEKARAQALSEMQAHVNPSMSTEQIQSLVASEAKKLMDGHEAKRQDEFKQQQAMNFAHQFINKLQAGKSEYDDFDEVTKDLNIASIPQVVQLAHSVDNTAAVMYELAKNPAKIGSLTTLSYIDPQLALKEMQLLSQSIKKNGQAAKQKLAEPPLNQLTPTTAGADNGVMTTKDWKNHPKWRV